MWRRTTSDMDPTGSLTWDNVKLASALKLSLRGVSEYFKDGRRIAFLVERRLAAVEDLLLADSEGASYDLKERTGERWEVRTVTKGGVFLCPSHMVGAGRKFELKGWLDKVASVKGFILVDVDLFPQCRYWAIMSEDVLSWWDRGLLGKTTSVSRKSILSMIWRLKEYSRLSEE